MVGRAGVRGGHGADRCRLDLVQPQRTGEPADGWNRLDQLSAYLWHWPIRVYGSFVARKPSIGLRLAELLGSFVLAWLTYRWVNFLCVGASLQPSSAA